jgi:carboxyl-terminal processing protease
MHKQGLSPEDAARFARLNGVWRSRGYGWLWAIGDGRLQVFDESGPFCMPRPDIRQRLEDLDRGFDLSADGRQLRLSLEDPAYRFTFDKIDALPERCLRPADASPMAVIDAVGQIFSAHYAFFKARHVDWPPLVTAAKKKVSVDTRPETLLEGLGGLLANFDDDHVTLVAKIAGKKYECDPGRAKILRRNGDGVFEPASDVDRLVARLQRRVWKRQDEDGFLAETKRIAANGNIKFGLIGGDIGYLSLLSMEDFDTGDADAAVLDEALDEAMDLFQGTRAVIVDVSLNDGGEDVLARRIAARFAKKRTPAYSKSAGDAPAAVPQAIYLEPSDRPRYTGRVYLMTSNVTVSAAEIFTFAMRALPNVTHVGETTRGALSDVLNKRLPNGWLVTLSNEIYLDSAGKAWEGRGIPPEVSIPVFARGDNVAATHLQAVRAVVDGIR